MSRKQCFLGDVIKFGNGKARPNSDGNYPIYGGNGILGYTGETNYNGETIIIGRVGAYCGSVYYENKPIWVSDNALAAKPKDFNDTKYLYYFLLNLQLNHFAEGSSHPLVTHTLLNSIDIEISDDENEQKAIAGVLSSLDDKIDLLHRQNKTLEAMAETLFRQWFENEENNSTISQLITIQNGYAFKSKDFINDGIHQIIKIRNISNGIVDIVNPDYVSNDVIKDLQCNFKIESGDILIAMTGADIGKLGIVPNTNRFLWLNQRVGMLKEKFPNSKYMAYLQLKSEFGQDHINSTATGSAQPNISGTGIEECGFPNVSEKEITACSNQIGYFYKKIIVNLGQIRTLEKLRETLLPKLMSGEVRVKY